MPHLTVELSGNLRKINHQDLLMQLNRVLIESGFFNEIDIKSRVQVFDDFLIGSSIKNGAFIHVKAAILDGRSVEIKKELSNQLLVALQNYCILTDDLKVQLCVEIQEIKRDFYSKTIS